MTWHKSEKSFEKSQWKFVLTFLLQMTTGMRTLMSHVIVSFSLKECILIGMLASEMKDEQSRSKSPTRSSCCWTRGLWGLPLAKQLNYIPLLPKTTRESRARQREYGRSTNRESWCSVTVSWSVLEYAGILCGANVVSWRNKQAHKTWTNNLQLVVEAWTNQTFALPSHTAPNWARELQKEYPIDR